MQTFASLSAASALFVLASASTLDTAITLNKAVDLTQRHARITNSCGYPVYLWSVVKGMGCPTDAMFTLPPGAVYAENLRSDSDITGISIKMSKSQACGGADISQLEYFLNSAGAYAANYLDMSFIDCPGGSCPGLKDGYHFVAGSQTGDQVASSDNTHCPVITCTDTTSCAKWSYMLPDDPQTRSCTLQASMDLNLCGTGPASSNPSSAPAKSAPAASSSKPTPSAAAPKAQAAAVTPVVQLNDNVVKNVKTEVVYVTAFQTINAKRHAYGHARRHQRFHA